MGGRAGFAGDITLPSPSRFLPLARTRMWVSTFNSNVAPL